MEIPALLITKLRRLSSGTQHGLYSYSTCAFTCVLDVSAFSYAIKQ
jgi:hypothetical protein